MPVQRVCRPDHTFRGFQGQIEDGEIHVGDEINTLPSNETARSRASMWDLTQWTQHRRDSL